MKIICPYYRMQEFMNAPTAPMCHLERIVEPNCGSGDITECPYKGHESIKKIAQQKYSQLKEDKVRIELELEKLCETFSDLVE